MNNLEQFINTYYSELLLLLSIIFFLVVIRRQKKNLENYNRAQEVIVEIAKKNFDEFQKMNLQLSEILKVLAKQ